MLWTRHGLQELRGSVGFGAEHQEDQRKSGNKPQGGKNKALYSHNTPQTGKNQRGHSTLS